MRLLEVRLMSNVVKELKSIIEKINPELCFRCNKCVSGCPVAKVVDEYRPNRIVRKAYLGLVDELINSELIWLCTQCFTCMERCPMDVAPADVIVALRNIASKRGKTHEVWARMASNILRLSAILPEMGVVTKDRKLVKREILGITVFKRTEKSVLKRIFEESGFPLKIGES